MRSHHIIAIAALLIVGFVVKVFYFSSPAAEAQVNATTMDVLQMHRDYPNIKGLPEQETKADLM